MNGWDRFGWWLRRVAIPAVAVLAAPGVLALWGLRLYVPAVLLACWCTAAVRWARRWPWCAMWLFRRELDQTRHVGGRTLFAYPFTAPVQRRRPVPREPRMREAGRRGHP